MDLQPPKLKRFVAMDLLPPPLQPPKLNRLVRDLLPAPFPSKLNRFERHRLEHPAFLAKIYRLSDYLADAKSLSQFEPDLRLELEELLELLEHASHCSSYCLYQRLCGNAMALYGHVMACKHRRTPTVCKLCGAMARIGKFHSRTCNSSHCGVPYCREMKEHKQKRAQRRETKRKTQDLRKQLLIMTISRKAEELRGRDHRIKDVESPEADIMKET